MTALISRRTTVAEYLVRRGLPADWRYGSPLGRVAATIYRETYRCEPGTAFRWINGRFRRVKAYLPSETHVLNDAWARYGAAVAAPAPRPACQVETRPASTGWISSIDSMRWKPTGGPVRSHP
ncbi:hypothetical protein ACIQPQ_34565 [Streptomyces sp. NPDC091281]|uniref:hypothetical protein n=1 Tax=Streptomyces sp. NPDC091281 TaxID=3365985 RepID=UPI00381A75C3